MNSRRRIFLIPRGDREAYRGPGCLGTGLGFDSSRDGQQIAGPKPAAARRRPCGLYGLRCQASAKIVPSSDRGSKYCGDPEPLEHLSMAMQSATVVPTSGAGGAICGRLRLTGRELSVRHVLEGSVRRSGNHVRVTLKEISYYRTR
jgi:hypothetical protein